MDGSPLNIFPAYNSIIESFKKKYLKDRLKNKKASIPEAFNQIRNSLYFESLVRSWYPCNFPLA